MKNKSFETPAPTKDRNKIVIKADTKIAIGHQSRAAGCGRWNDKRCRRNRSKAAQTERSVREFE